MAGTAFAVDTTLFVSLPAPFTASDVTFSAGLYDIEGELDLSATTITVGGTVTTANGTISGAAAAIVQAALQKLRTSGTGKVEITGDAGAALTGTTITSALVHLKGNTELT